MLLKNIVIGALMAIPALASANSLTETRERMAIEQQAIAYTVSQKWDKLDAMFQEYNTGFPTTSGGTHKLVIAWGGIYNLFSVDVSDNGISGVAKEWLKANPKSTGARLLQAMVFDAKAVNLRGEGAASTVDSDIWPKYKKLMIQEKEYLLKNKDIADKDVTWYQEMEMVARNLEDKELLYSTLEEASKNIPPIKIFISRPWLLVCLNGVVLRKKSKKSPEWPQKKTKINRDFLTTLISGVMQSITNLN